MNELELIDFDFWASTWFVFTFLRRYGFPKYSLFIYVFLPRFYTTVY